MRRLVTIIILTLVIKQLANCQDNNWFDNNTINTIVLLEKKVGNDFVPHGTGFLIYDYSNRENAIIVTCKHLLKNREVYVTIDADSSFLHELKKNNNEYALLANNFWELDKSVLRTKVNLIKDSTYVVHPDGLDIGGFKISYWHLLIDTVTCDTLYITSRKKLAKSYLGKNTDIGLGDDIYFLGFPFKIGTTKGFLSSGYYADNISNPLLRTGIISWKSENNSEFLIDAFSYGGNSGSPIFLKKLNYIEKPILIGMIIGHLGDEFSPQGAKGNSGLARCLYVDDIKIIINLIQELD